MEEFKCNELATLMLEFNYKDECLGFSGDAGNGQFLTLTCSVFSYAK